MKRATIYLLLILFICIAAACGTPGVNQPSATPAANSATPTANIAPTPTVAPATPVAPSTPSPEQAASKLVPDENKLKAMLPVFEAIINASTDEIYDGNDPYYFWSVMYFIGVNNGTANPKAMVAPDDINIIIPTQLVDEYASALFANYSKMPALPEDMDFPITYAKDQDAYLMELSDSGEVEYAISSYEAVSDTQITATVQVKYDDGTQEYKFVLQTNSTAAKMQSPVFYYAVVSVEPVD